MKVSRDAYVVTFFYLRERFTNQTKTKIIKMRKIYFSVLSALVLLTANGFAQSRSAQNTHAMNLSSLPSVAKNQTPVEPMTLTMDTLTNHWHVIYPVAVGSDTALTYSACSSSSYVAGNNCYGDKSKVQKFDSAYGVTTSYGTITSILFWFGAKVVGAGTATYTPTIWSDNGGKPGTVLGAAPSFTISTLDTNFYANQHIGPLTAIKGMYNNAATFSSPIAIPANKKFWAGITYSYAAGDSAGLVTSYDYGQGDAAGLTGDCKEASTYTFEQWSSNAWHSFNDGTTSSWQLDVALAVYPVISFSSAVNELNSNVYGLKNYPNPASNNTMISYSLKESANVEVSVFDVTGKQIISFAQGMQTVGNHNLKLDVSNLNSGMYFYTIAAGANKMTSKISVVK